MDKAKLIEQLLKVNGKFRVPFIPLHLCHNHTDQINIVQKFSTQLFRLTIIKGGMVWLRKPVL